MVYCFKVVRFTAACLRVAKWSPYTTAQGPRLIELVRPGRCASRNQAEVRAALDLEVVWYEATWEMALHGTTNAQKWINNDQHLTVPHP